MKERILAILSANAIRTQILGDNKLHSLIADDEFGTVADAIVPLFDDLKKVIEDLTLACQAARA